MAAYISSDSDEAKRSAPATCRLARLVQVFLDNQRHLYAGDVIAMAFNRDQFFLYGCRIAGVTSM